MRARTRCIIVTRDEALKQRLSAYLTDHFDLVTVSDAEAVNRVLGKDTVAVILLDLRLTRALDLLDWITTDRPNGVVICFAQPRSRPAIAAEQFDVFAMQSLEPDRKSLKSLVRRAAEFAGLRSDHALLASAPQVYEPASNSTLVPETRVAQAALAAVTRTFQNLGDPDGLLQHVIDIAAKAIVTTRTGLYVKKESVFALAAQVRCPAGKIFEEDAPFVRWAESSGAIAVRSRLRSIKERTQREMLAQTLDDLGAEAIIPLLGTLGLVGWLFIGARASGEPLTSADLEFLMSLGASVTGPVENSILYRRADVSNHILERLFDALPCGVLALNDRDQILWLNRAAEELFGVEFHKSIGQESSLLGEAISQFYTGYKSRHSPVSTVIRTNTGVAVEIRIEQLASSSSADKGYLMLAQDVSVAEELRKRREESFRGEIVTQMAASVAFELRGPLSTIKTFTQLLPERRGEPEFAVRCGEVVGREVERLSDLSDSLCTISMKPGESTSAPVVFEVSRLTSLVRCLSGADWEHVELSVRDDLPRVEGDCTKLAQCVCHLLANAREANADRHAKVRLSIDKANVSKNIQALRLMVCDGRAVEKAGLFVDNTHLASRDAIQRADLRLSFANDIVSEFAGHMSLSTTPEGVSITILLPIFIDETTPHN